MSLFKCQELWRSPLVEEEEDIYGFGCLLVCNIDNNPSPSDKILVCNYKGTLSIYKPSLTKSKSEGDKATSIAEDLLLHVSLDEPILQISAGRFVSGQTSLHLGVLHPRKLAVYSVLETTSNTVEHGSQYRMALCYEHKLQRSAFHFCYGPFGRVQGKDNLCVQFLDGTLSVYEQEAFSFSRFLPASLLPGPLDYLPKTDCFVTVSSCRQLECYRYEILAIASDINPKEDTQRQNTAKKASAEWEFNLGEEALDLRIVGDSVLILGERSIFCISEMGQLRFCKKLDCTASSLCPFRLGTVDNDSVSYIVSSVSNSLLIYNNTTLKWAASCQDVPIQTCVGKFMELSGVIVTLSDQGRVSCSSLGTHPTLFVSPIIESREISFDSMTEELASLQSVAKNLSQNVPVVLSKSDNDEVSFIIDINPDIQALHPSMNLDSEIHQLHQDIVIPVLIVNLTVKSRVLIDNITMSVIVSWPLATDKSEFSISSIAPSSPYRCSVHVHQVHLATIADLSFIVKARFLSSSGSPRIITKKVDLPIKLVVQPATPLKNAIHKLTLDSNDALVNLNDIYPDLKGETPEPSGQAFGLRYLSGDVVTILASKTSQRYRIQGDKLEALWLVLKDFHRRLKNYFSHLENVGYHLAFNGNLPFKEIFDTVDAHFHHRQEVSNYQEILTQKAAQFRVIQRRLLTKFKDKTLTSLDHLDTLLEGNYQQIMSLSTDILECEHVERMCANDVSACIYILLFLLQIWLKLSDLEMEALAKVLSPEVPTGAGQGWEESVDGSITHVLRTAFARASRDSVINPAPFTQSEDLAKLKKHIVLFCDKLEQGCRLSSTLRSDNQNPHESKSTESARVQSSSFHALSKNLDTTVHQDNIISEDIPHVDLFTNKHTFGKTRHTLDERVTQGVRLLKKAENRNNNAVSSQSIAVDSNQSSDMGNTSTNTASLLTENANVQEPDLTSNSDPILDLLPDLDQLLL